MHAVKDQRGENPKMKSLSWSAPRCICSPHLAHFVIAILPVFYIEIIKSALDVTVLLHFLFFLFCYFYTVFS